jgi:phospholipase/carboxylesterase
LPTRRICPEPDRAAAGVSVTGVQIRAQSEEATEMHNALIIQKPAPASTGAQELLLLFHGVGANAQDLEPLGRFLAQQRPQAWVISVQAPLASEGGRGWQWFSVTDITQANRPARVVEAMPAFIDTVNHWQQQAGVTAAMTTLIGFSQGSIMALESTQHGSTLAGRVVAIAGRFAEGPRRGSPDTVVHLMHGDQDPVMPTELATDAASALRSLGVNVTLDVFPGLGHGIDTRVLRRIAERLEADPRSQPVT